MDIDEALTFSPVFNGGSGSDTAVINAGTWRLSTDSVLTSDNLNIVANNDAIVVTTATQHLASVTLNNTARFSVGTNGSRVMKMSALTMSPDAIFDLFDNDLMLQATAANRQAMLAMVSGLVASARAGGAWNGKGLRSATAANNALHTTGLATVLNDRGDGTTIVSSFDGETPNNNAILVKYTYNGDANLDGQLNADDYTQIDAGFATHATGWFNGDFNYSGGAPNSDDYFAIDRAYADQGAPLSTPEAPASAVVQASAPASSNTTSTTSAASATRAAVKVPEKKHKHHKRDVIDTLEIEPRQILQRRRD